MCTIISEIKALFFQIFWLPWFIDKLMWGQVCFILRFPCIAKSTEWENKSSLIPPNIDRCSRLYLLPLIPLIRIHLSLRICIYNNSSYIFFLQQSINTCVLWFAFAGENGFDWILKYCFKLTRMHFLFGSWHHCTSRWLGILIISINNLGTSLVFQFLRMWRGIQGMWIVDLFPGLGAKIPPAAEQLNLHTPTTGHAL